jgi:class 3 adenylate cyclase
MLFGNVREKNRATWLWLATIMTICFWIIGRQVFLIENSFVDLLDRKWMAFKQSQQLWIRQSEMRPSKQVALLQMEYSNRIEFWFDDAGRKKLAEKLQTYEGPILWNADPVLATKDKFLAPLFAKKNLVRMIRNEPVILSRAEDIKMKDEVERLASDRAEQAPEVNWTVEECVANHNVSRCAHDPFQIFPSDPAFFSKGYLWGIGDLGRSLIGKASEGTADMQLISELPMRLPSATREIPNMLLGAVALQSGCSDYLLRRDNSLQLKSCSHGDKVIQLQDPLPMFFYRNFFGSWPYWRVELDQLPKDKILVVDLIDSASTQQNFRGEPYTWGALMATALSNLLEGHTPKWSPAIGWMERFIFVLALTTVIVLYRRANLKWYLERLVLILIAVAALDFIATVYFNVITRPVGEFFSVALAGFVGLGILSWRDAERRSLIERALSGYVSPQRLQSLISGDEKLELAGRREELTTLLLDIRGFSLLTKEMDVEAVFPFVQEFFSTIDPIVFKYGGVIDKKLGDGMLAFFGDAHGISAEEAAKAAVSAALEIQKRLLEISEGLLGTQKIAARIGVNTGIMMIGNSGSEKHFNYTVLGEPVNTTARLETACPSGSVLVGEETAKYVRSAWKLAPMPISVKHEEGSLTAYLVLEPIR